MSKKICSNIICVSIYQIEEGHCPFDLKEDKVSQIENYAKFVKRIYVEKPVIKGRKVKEVLTGVEFDSIYCAFSLKNDCLYKGKKGLIHTAVNTSYLYTLDFNDEDFKCYMELHKDIEAYRKYLEELKTRGYEIAKNSLLAVYQQSVDDSKGKCLTKECLHKARRYGVFMNQENK